MAILFRYASTLLPKSSPVKRYVLAHAIEDTLVKWLDPKPLTYRKPNPESVDFKGYQVG